MRCQRAEQGTPSRSSGITYDEEKDCCYFCESEKQHGKLLNQYEAGTEKMKTGGRQVSFAMHDERSSCQVLPQKNCLLDLP